jgi:hypothetical protein
MEKTRTKGLNKDFGIEINRPFYIMSKMDSRRVVVAHGAHHVRIQTMPGNHKTWRQCHFTFDQKSKTIKSGTWTNRSLAISGRNVILQPTNSRWFQLWEYKNGQLTNTHGLNLEAANDVENSNIRAGKKNGKDRQQFEIVYVDEYQDTKDGELDKHYNMIAKKPFHIISTLANGRYLDVISNQIVIKKRNGFTSQQWYWDPRSKSIKNVKNN